MEPWLDQFAKVAFERSADTSHDLKTPLNISILNLELLRLRCRKLLDGSDDPKLDEYVRSIETELRRMARIFDAYFVFATPPAGEGAPQEVKIDALAIDAGTSFGFIVEGGNKERSVSAHPSRMIHLFSLFFDSARRYLSAESRLATVQSRDQFWILSARGPSAHVGGPDLSKIFKFYYTDQTGSPDLTFATARLIAETCGGALDVIDDAGELAIVLKLPLGER